MGWVLSPSWLTGALVYEKGLADGFAPVLDQLALADFIARGELDRHLRRMRPRYRARREALIAAIASAIPGARATGIPAGLYTLVLLDDGIDERTVVSAAAARGVVVEGLGWHRLEPTGPPGLVLGYGNLSEPAIGRGVAALAEAAGSSPAMEESTTDGSRSG